MMSFLSLAVRPATRDSERLQAVLPRWRTHRLARSADGIMFAQVEPGLFQVLLSTLLHLSNPC